LREEAARTAPRPAQPLALAELKRGQEVWVETLRANARVVSVSSDQARVTVRAGGVSFEVRAGDIGRREAAAAGAGPAPLPERRPRTVEPVAAELLLLGKRVDEAVPLLEQYLDRAALAGLPEVRIVHGFGSGRLQAAVHDLLRGHPLVARFRLGSGGRDPGGGGATRVELRRD
jgi:DNA mismatch repair protein MutS2